MCYNVARVPRHGWESEQLMSDEMCVRSQDAAASWWTLGSGYIQNCPVPLFSMSMPDTIRMSWDTAAGTRHRERNIHTYFVTKSYDVCIVCNTY